jgi:hypothetical protein
MNKIKRMSILKSAQIPPANTPAQNTTPAIVKQMPPAHIDIRSMPGFNTNLFNAKPAAIEDVNNIVNIINKYLTLLSVPQGSITFATTYTNPSISGSEGTNSVKNLLNLGKWMYNVIRARTQAYSLDGIREIGTGLIKTVDAYSFPEPAASTIKSELVVAAQSLIAKVPVGH